MISRVGCAALCLGHAPAPLGHSGRPVARSPSGELAGLPGPGGEVGADDHWARHAFLIGCSHGVACGRRLAQMAAVTGVSRIMGPARMRALLAVPGTSPGGSRAGGVRGSAHTADG